MERVSPQSDPVECLRLLGLPPAASAAQIKQAYRRLAQRFHPDKCGGDEIARRHFITICMAYRTLMRNARLVAKNVPMGRCSVCGEFGEAVIGLDGLTRCPSCTLRPGRRLCLPLPSLTIAKCTGAFVMLSVSVCLLIRAIQTEDLAYVCGGIAAGLGVIAAVALTCLRVVSCIQPREQKAQQQARNRHRVRP